jgi:predicted AAA+ superfamily ATPase
MVHRITVLPEKRSFFLLGPRQTGKSTLIEHLYRQENTWFLDFLKQDQFLKYTKFPAQFREEAIEKITHHGITHIVLDEIQRISPLLNEVHYLLEKHPCQFILSGSSARKLKRSDANMLAGRAVQRYLFPLTYQETQSTFNLEDTLRFGSLPAIYECPAEEKIDILSTYVNIYLKEEIQQEGLVRNLSGFSRFLDIAASQCGELLNFSTMARECYLSVKTVQGYYEILEDTLIGFKLLPWHKSLRKRLVQHPKFYLFDCGITNAINQRLQAPADPQLKGRLFEQWLVLETYRQRCYQQSEANLFFWRTNHGAEVDLLIEKHGKITGAFEIKSTQHVSGGDLSGLRAFQEDFPDVPCHVISGNEEPFHIGNVSILPWPHYLQRLSTFL